MLSIKNKKNVFHAIFFIVTFSFTFICTGNSSNQREKLPYRLDMVYNNPGEKPQATKFRNPDFLKEMQYNGQVPHCYVQCAISYDSFEKGLFPPKSKEAVWIKKQADKIDSLISKTNSNNFKIYPFTDVLVIPKALYNKHKAKLKNFSIKNDFVKQLIKVQIDEIFTRFPKLGGLTIRFGETYLQDTPYHIGKSPVHTPEEHIILLKILREEVCVKRNKKLFYRTWDFGNRFHTNPKFYLKVTNSIKPHKNLIFSIKHTKGDFLRTLPFNPTLGIGNHQQIVEVQCQREYEGKGAHPNYIAKGVINGFIEMKKSQFPSSLKGLLSNSIFSGLWTWSRGGGWQGPYITNELWCEVNAYVLTRWANDPSITEEEILRDFAQKRLNLKKEGADAFVKICHLSEKGVLLGQYSQIAWIPIAWERDERLGGLKQLKQAFKRIIKSKLVEKIIDEKKNAVEIWTEIEALSKKVNAPDKQTDKFIRVSASYGRIKYEIIEKGWTVILLGMLGDSSGKYQADRIQQAIKEYDKLWNEWRQLRKNNPLCPTLYRGTYCRFVPQKGMFDAPGMDSSINLYRKRINTLSNRKE